MSEKYNPSSWEQKELLRVNIVDEMEAVLKAIDGKISPEMMDKLDWSIRAIQVRLSIAEGNISILHSSHLGHTNYHAPNFQQMHGILPAGENTPGNEQSDPVTNLTKALYGENESAETRATKLAMMLAIELNTCYNSEDPSPYMLGKTLVQSLAEIYGLEVVDSQ